MRAWIGVILLAVMVWPGPTAAQFYKYVDRQGNVRFTDDINQVPETQRGKSQSYVESQSTEVPPDADATGPKDKTSGVPVVSAVPATDTAAAQEGEGSLDEARMGLDARKKEVETEYRALMKEKERLAKEKEGSKTRDEINAYNKAVEAFNQSAALYEKKSEELRKLVEDYNAQVAEANTKAAPARK